MKRTVYTAVMSILLILASLFGLASAGLGIKDVLDIKAYKEEEAKEAEVVSDLEAAIVMLQENEQAYLDGIGAYTKGLADYNSGSRELSKGQSDYNTGKKTLEEGKKALEEGYAAYEAGKKELEAGKAQVAEGQALIDANTEAYNEGKEKLAKIEPLLPYVEAYIQFRDNRLGSIGGFSSAQLWFTTLVRPIAANAGLDIPANVTDFPAYIEQMVADGKAQLKEYEDGLIALEEGKAKVAAGEKALKEAEAQLAAGEAEVAAGEKELAEGKKKLDAGRQELAAGAEKLKDGLASLEQFEDGMRQVDGYVAQLLEQKDVYRHDGELAIAGPAARLGKDFDWYKHNDNGEIAALRSGDAYLDLDKCMEVCTAFRAYVSEQGEDVTQELYSRVGIYAALALASLLGLVAGIIAIAGKNCAIFGVIIAVIGVGCNIYGLMSRYAGYTYPLKDGTYSGGTQLIALILFAIVAVMFAAAAVYAKAASKAEADR